MGRRGRRIVRVSGVINGDVALRSKTPPRHWHHQSNKKILAFHVFVEGGLKHMNNVPGMVALLAIESLDVL